MRSKKVLAVVISSTTVLVGLGAAPANAAQSFAMQYALGGILQGDAVGSITFRQDGRSFHIDRLLVYDRNGDGKRISVRFKMKVGSNPDEPLVNSRLFEDLDGANGEPGDFAGTLIVKDRQIRYVIPQICYGTAAGPEDCRDTYSGVDGKLINPNDN